MRNKVNLIGHVGNNLEVKEYKSGKKRAFFTLIIDESYKNEDRIWVYKNTPVNHKNQNGYMIFAYQITATEIYFLSGMHREKEKIETQEV